MKRLLSPFVPLGLLVLAVASPVRSQVTQTPSVPTMDVQQGQVLPPSLYIYDPAFAIAFLRHAGNKNQAHVEVGISEDGQHWTDLEHPTLGSVTLGDTNGVGLCGSPSGLKMTVVGNIKDAGFFLTQASRTGPNVAWSSSTAIPASPLPDSAPTCAYVQERYRVVAYRSGHRVAIRVIDDAGADVTSALPLTFNDHVEGRPSVASLGNKLLFAWRRAVGDCAQLVVSEGEFTSVGGTLPSLPFTDAVLFPLEATEHGPCAVSDPALAAGVNHFYLTVVQAPRSTGAGHGWETLLYRSRGADLDSGWTPSVSVPVPTRNDSYVNLAAYTQAPRGAIAAGPFDYLSSPPKLHLFVAAVKNSDQGPNPVNAEIYTQDGMPSPWTDPGNAPWLGVGDASYRQFGTGHFTGSSPHPRTGINLKGLGYEPK